MSKSPRTFANEFRIDLREASEYRNREYGITHESNGTFETASRNSRHFPHRVIVWDNTVREIGDGRYIDPNGAPTKEPISILINAIPIVLTAHKDPNPDPRLDIFLQDGDIVDLVYPDGKTLFYVAHIPNCGQQKLIKRS